MNWIGVWIEVFVLAIDDFEDLRIVRGKAIVSQVAEDLNRNRPVFRCWNGSIYYRQSVRVIYLAPSDVASIGSRGLELEITAIWNNMGVVGNGTTVEPEDIGQALTGT